MTDFTAEDYQRIINTLSAQKAQAELAAMEWRLRYEKATVQDGAEEHPGGGDS